MKTNRLKTISILVLILTLVISPMSSFAASDWNEGNIKLIDTDDHAWLIRFNLELDESSLTNDNIYIKDSKGNTLPSQVEPVGQDRVQIIPAESYKPGEEHILMITNGVKTPKGKALKQEVNMKFSTNLQVTTEKAEALHNKSLEGQGTGLYKPGSKTIFNDKIQEAKDLLKDTLTYTEEIQAIKNLKQAIDIFNENKILNSLETISHIKLDGNGELSFVDSSNNSKQIGYKINLYKDAEKIETIDIGKETRTYKLLPAMKKQGEGTYSATVTTLGDKIDHSDSIESPKSQSLVITKLSTPSISSWGENSISWTSVSGTDSYELSLYKDQTLVKEAIKTAVPNYNFASTFKELGLGSYRIKVKAIAKDTSLNIDSNLTDYSAVKVVKGQLQAPKTISLNDKGIVTWGSVASATGYEIKLYKGETPLGTTAMVGKDIKTYDFLSTIKAHGDGEYSATVKALGDKDFGASEESEKSKAVTAGKLPAPTIGNWSGSTG